MAADSGQDFNADRKASQMVRDPKLRNLANNMVVQITSILQRNWRKKQRNERQRAVALADCAEGKSTERKNVKSVIKVLMHSSLCQ